MKQITILKVKKAKKKKIFLGKLYAKKTYARHDRTLSNNNDNDMDIYLKNRYNNIQNFAQKHNRNLKRIEDFRRGSLAGKIASSAFGKKIPPYISKYSGTVTGLAGEFHNRYINHKTGKWPKSQITKQLDKHSPFDTNRSSKIKIKSKYDDNFLK